MKVVEGKSGQVPGLLQRSRRQGLTRTSATCCNSQNKISLGWGSDLVLPVAVCHSAQTILAPGHPLQAMSITYHVHGYESDYHCLPATLVAQHKQELHFSWSRPDASTRNRLPLEAAKWVEGTHTCHMEMLTPAWARHADQAMLIPRNSSWVGGRVAAWVQSPLPSCFPNQETGSERGSHQHQIAEAPTPTHREGLVDAPSASCSPAVLAPLSGSSQGLCSRQQTPDVYGTRTRTKTTPPVMTRTRIRKAALLSIESEEVLNKTVQSPPPPPHHPIQTPHCDLTPALPRGPLTSGPDLLPSLHSNHMGHLLFSLGHNKLIPASGPLHLRFRCP